MSAANRQFKSDVADSFMLDYVLFMSKVEAAKKGWDKTPVDKQRLKDRLELFGFEERPTKGDGNCQFYAVSDQLFDDDRHAGSIRANAVKWLRMNGDWNPNNSDHGELKYFAGESWNTYCNRMSRDRQWGDHLTLIAIAEVYNVSIRIISSVPGPQFMTEINPSAKEKWHAGRDKTIFIAHHLEYHYISIKESNLVSFTVSPWSKDTMRSAYASLAATAERAGNLATAQKYTIKAVNVANKDVRRVSVIKWPGLPEIDHWLNDTWGNKLPQPYTLKYIDEDNDEVIISTTPELEEAIRFATDKNQSSPELALLVVPSTSSSLSKQNASASILKIPSSFEEKVRALMRLGYTDMSKNVDLLITFGGDLEKTLQSLADNQNSYQKHSPPQNIDSIPVELSPKWCDILSQLEQMGFTDLDRNLESLIANGGDLTEVAIHLASTQDKEKMLNDLIDG
eukprot:CAMPEP_0201551818 /NCGR_PEP_ID=MMETSP0173_2-20130828/10524_1 /ASSEMBLY_ACC=CAM_ASM_000268 /TAXON_ID=218659 /ORGANISM="Vexillifera sp., Strain DIVA3 564/2" /LENGTH=452 /DNA_ID=CAMNT_0047962163 /DNA_START=28 /DNA_END=1386 /DNA_ORIENTATION=+